MPEPISRRSFWKDAGLGAAALSMGGAALAEVSQPQADSTWEPVSDRKIRVGIVGYGVCKFGAQFSFQHHPNVEVVAVSDLFPDRCQQLASACQCEKTYPSLEKMIQDDSIEAVFCATDAPRHARHCQDILRHGKHVACAVPAVFGSLEEADQLFEAVQQSGLNYMLFETSCFHEDLYAMRQIYQSGGFGKLVYSEGEYFHYAVSVLDSYQGWRVGLPPQWYPTHSNAYYVGVAGGSFTDVSCLAMPSLRDELQPKNNRYQNPFGTEIALFRTSEGGMARMGVSWDAPGHGGETGRVRGQRGSMIGMKYQGLDEALPHLARPPLPREVPAGGHGGSHGQLSHEFVMSILEDRPPSIDIAQGLNMTVAGIVAHQSALKNGQLMKIPQYP